MKATDIFYELNGPKLADTALRIMSRMGEAERDSFLQRIEERANKPYLMTKAETYEAVFAALGFQLKCAGLKPNDRR